MRNRNVVALVLLSILVSLSALAASIGGVFYPAPYRISSTRPACGSDSTHGTMWVGFYFTGGSAIDRLEVCSVASPTGTPAWHYVTVGTAAAPN